MEKRKVCLFTAHSPLSGGGGAILRSLVNGLSNVSVDWYYTHDTLVADYQQTYLGKPLMGGNVLKDIWQTWKLLTQKTTVDLDRVVNRLIDVECDVFWIVSHNEGLRIALELTRRQNRPVHMTVHDDWAGALCARSARYRCMAGAAKSLTIDTLQGVTSFDVVSKGMFDYYLKLTGLPGKVCHRYLEEGAIKRVDVVKGNDSSLIVAGHIGSIYSKADFIHFLSVFQEFAAERKKKALMKMWGCHLTIADMPVSLQDNVVFYDTLPEREVIPELANCVFVYAMYPFADSLKVFSQTSLPTKLTTYLQSGRPILAHTPAGSSLVEFMSANNLGVVYSSMDKEAGFKCLDQLLCSSPGFDEFDNARKQYFGEKNIEIMNSFLLNP